jgi:hypothetical protein
MAELEEKNIVVDAIAIQETWDVKYTDLVPLLYMDLTLSYTSAAGACEVVV